MTRVSDAAPTPARRLWPPRRVLVTLASLATAIVMVRSGLLETVIGPIIDQAVVNVITLILGFSMLVSLLVWFWRESGFAVAVKRGVFWTIGLAVLAAIALVRIERVSGDLVPEFVWRWSRSRDRLLPASGELPEGVPAEAGDFSPTPRDYPRFLGSRVDATLVGPPPVGGWNANPPERLWRQPIGAGWGSFAVVGEHAATLEQRGDEEIVACYDVETGRCEWAVGVAARHATVLGGVGPRSTPTIFEGVVYAHGATGWLHAIRGSDGELLWRTHILDDLGIDREAHAAAVAWGRAASPLVTPQWVIVPAGGPRDGGPVSLAVYERATGRLATTLGDEQISYASPVLVECDGRPLVLNVNESRVVAYDLPAADDPPGPAKPPAGTPVFAFDWPGHSDSDASCSQAHLLPAAEAAGNGRRVFVSKGYGVGCAVVAVSPEADGEGGAWRVEPLWHKQGSLKTKFANVVFRDGHAYGLSDGILECVRLSDGRRAWKRGRYHQGQVLRIDDVLLVVAESGEVALVECSPEGFNELCRFEAIRGQTWNNPAVSGDRLLVRNAQEAACYRIPRRSDPAGVASGTAGP